MPQTRRLPPVSATFAAKKAQVLSLLTQPEEDYNDKSPKGTVDAQIRDLIDEINAYGGLVTTSSCAGRVAVFVEGPKAKSVGGGQSRPDAQGDEVAHTNGKNTQQSTTSDEASEDNAATPTTTTTTASPGGKGGGRWLYVSHDPITLPAPTDCDGPPVESSSGTKGESSGRYTSLFNLTSCSAAPSSGHPAEVASSPQLIHLSFSPLILHIHCATLQHARPLLAAAINAGFRESGLQSLRILDDPEHGAMVAVRTAGLAFETVVGVVSQSEVSADDGGESESEEARQDVMTSLVSEEYLSMCVGVVNERFKWNDGRRERFREELRKAMVREGLSVPVSAAEGEREEKRDQNGWEDKDERRRRKRMEGLSRQRDKTQTVTLHKGEEGQGQERDDGLDEGLGALGIE
jgi:tRNA wybutosine-synthesizing protein 3